MNDLTRGGSSMKTAQHDNLIAGEWKKAASYSPNINPSNLADVVGEYAQGDAGDVDAAVAAATRRVSGLGDRQHPGAQRRARQDRHRDPRASRRARDLAVARGGQDPARGHRRSHAGRPDLQVLRRRMPAPVGRAAAFGAPGHRRGDHARADRRGRTDHAVELSDRDPGLEGRRRRSPTATAWCSSPPTSCRARPGRWPRSSRAPGIPRGRVQPGDGPRQRDRRRAGPPSPASTPSASPARSASAVASREACAHEPRRRCSSRWAARTRRSCSTTPISAQAVELSVQSAFYSTGQRCTASSRLIVTEGIYRQFVDGDEGPHGEADGRRRARGGHRHRPGLEPEPARAGPELHRDRPARGRHAGRRRRAAEARHRRLLHGAGAVQRDRQRRCASTARRSSVRSRA